MASVHPNVMKSITKEEVGGELTLADLELEATEPCPVTANQLEDTPADTEEEKEKSLQVTGEICKVKFH